MDSNWDDLRLFLASRAKGSLSGAGKTLRLDPATLGRRMTRLEGATGTVLFVKSPQGYALTEAGQQTCWSVPRRLNRRCGRRRQSRARKAKA